MSDIAAPTTATLTTERILKVRGGRVLRGDVFISGAKNAALKAMAATLLTRDEVVLNNVPMLADVLSMAELLRAFGAEVEVDRTQGHVTVQVKEITRTSAPPDLFRPTRASVVAVGPMLARCGEVSFVMPGGDKIGRRPIDVHLRGFERMGATVEQTGDVIQARVDKLRGARIYMDYPSHTGTENLLMASTLAAGKTTIFNASAEPEVVWLGHLLNRMGARISGLGSPILTIDGVERLHGVSDYIIPDRLEAGSFAIGAVMTGGEVTLHDVREAHMLPLTEKLMEVGADVWFRQDRMLVRSGDSLRSVDIQTLPFPGFPTDLQAPFTALLTQVSGVSRVHERVYEDRLRYTSELRKMGADIRVDRIGNASELLATSAEVHGPSRLRGARVAAIDIRAAICMVLAGLVADGETELEEVYHVDRGYENFVEKLTNIGGDVEDTVPNV